MKIGKIIFLTLFIIFVCLTVVALAAVGFYPAIFGYRVGLDAATISTMIGLSAVCFLGYIVN